MSSGATTPKRRRSGRKASLSTVVSVRLTLSTGPELFAAVHSAPSASERIKQLATLGLAAERAGVGLEGLLAGAALPTTPAPVPRVPPTRSIAPAQPAPVRSRPVAVEADQPAPLNDAADLDAAMLGAKAFGFG
jgi:hypothetical protein